MLVFFHELPILRLGLDLSHEWIAVQFFISYLILIFAWALSGPLTATVLSLLSAVLVIYVTLSTKEPTVFLQILVYGFLFMAVVSYLNRVQKQIGDKKLTKEKLEEECHLVQDSILKREAVKKALEHKRSRYLGLERFSEELKGLVTVEAVSGKLAHEAARLIGQTEESVLYLVDESKQDLTLVASFRQDEAVIKEKEGSIFDHWVLKKFQPLLIEDSKNDFRFSLDPKAESSNLVSLGASPLMTERKVLGVLRIASSRVAAFTQDDVRLLDTLASLGAVYLKNILLYQKMGELAVRDGLTGLYLNRYFQERLTEEIHRSTRHKKRFSLLLLDIDYFKKYNDEYGHAAGDMVLKNVSQSLARCLEPTDLVARYGGEEFVVLLPGCEMKEAMKIAEKVRKSVASNPFTVRRMEGKVTASLGVATFPEAGHTSEELLMSADRNLYQAKRLGRNRVWGNS